MMNQIRQMRGNNDQPQTKGDEEYGDIGRLGVTQVRTIKGRNENDIRENHASCMKGRDFQNKSGNAKPDRDGHQVNSIITNVPFSIKFEMTKYWKIYFQIKTLMKQENQVF